MLDMKLHFTSGYHPEADGQTERVNQTLEQYLRHYVSYQQDNWSTLLPLAEFAYNNAANESTGLSPFMVEYGYNPKMNPVIMGDPQAPSLKNLFAHRTEAQEQAAAALTLAAERFKWYYDLNKGQIPFKQGDLVMLKGEDLRIRRTSKLAAKNYGPYEIIEQTSPVNFKLKLPHQVKIHPVFHASKLIPYKEDQIAGRNPSKPPPIQVEGQDEFEVEAIKDSKISRRKVQYLVKWKGYPESENTWEPVRHLTHCWDLVEHFHTKHPEAPQPISPTNGTPRDSSGD